MEQRVSLITLGVSDLERARAFYGALGWTDRRDVGDEVTFVQAGGMVVALWSRESLAADCAVPPGREGRTGDFGGFALAYNVRSPEEVDRVLDQAREAGAEVRRDGAPTEWGGYSGLFADPDGHPWEVAHNPDWTIEPDGSVRL